MKKLLFLFIITFLTYGENKKLKIVSTMPSLTEMVFYLDQGSHLVGVTPYCLYPKKAQSVTKIGSAIMLDYEKIIKQKTDLVLLPAIVNKKSRDDLDRLNIKYLEIGHERLSDIIYGLHKLNLDLGANRLSKVQTFENYFKNITKNQVARKVLVVISEEVSGGKISSVRVASQKTIYTDLLNLSGDQNIINLRSPYPVLTLEELMKLDFDYILRVGPEDKNEIRLHWNNSPFKSKVRFVLRDYAVVTGPRLTNLHEDIERALK